MAPSAVLDVKTEKKNPFINTTAEMTLLEKVKCVCMIPIAFVRLLLVLLVLLWLLFWCFVATLCHPKVADPATEDLKPMGPCRRALLVPFQWGTRWILFLFGYHWIHETGCCHCFNPCASNPAPAPVIVCNHVSYIDPVYMLYKFLPCAAGMSELASYPAIGILFRSITPILVERTTPQGRTRAALQMKLRPQSSVPVSEDDKQKLEEMRREVQAMPTVTPENLKRKEMKEHALHLEEAAQERRPMKPAYPPMLAFPEGTTTGFDTLLQFKRGAFASGQPVQPVVVKYPFCNYEVVWSCDQSLGWTFIRMLLQVYNCMTVHYLPVHYPTDEEKDDAQLYADNVRQEMCMAMCEMGHGETVMTDHAYEDVRLLVKATAKYKGENKLNTEEVTYSKMRKMLDVSPDEATKILEKFIDADKDLSGTINEEEFAAGLGMDPDDPGVAILFRILDQDGSGEIEYQELIDGMIMVSGSMSEQDKIDRLFNLYDTNGDGKICRNEISQIIGRRAAGPWRRPTKQSLRSFPNKAINNEVGAEETDEFLDKIMAGRASLNEEEFKAEVRQFPQLTKFVEDGINHWSKEGLQSPKEGTTRIAEKKGQTAPSDAPSKQDEEKFV